MKSEEFLDKLDRAVLMEEEMAGVLIDLCEPGSLPADLPEKVRMRVGGILLAIKEDTLRHRKIVSQIKGNLS